MGKPDNLVGQTFNYLTVIEKDTEYKKIHNLSPKNTSVYWKCRCVCGKITSVRGDALKKGGIKSCGCKHKELQSLVFMKDITGQKFNHLLALEPVFDYAKTHNIKNSSNIIYWKCLCDCGEFCIEPGNDLRNDKIFSCINCARKSKGEAKISELLKENKINFLYNTSYFKDLMNKNKNCLLRYDFIVLNNENQPEYLIEFDGEQHFRPVKRWGGMDRLNHQIENDSIKNEYAKAHNLPLIRIPYKHYQQLCLDDLQLSTTKFLV